MVKKREIGDPFAEGGTVNEWMQAHSWYIVIALVSFHMGAMAEWWSKRDRSV